MKTKENVIGLFKELGLNLEYVDSNQDGQDNYAVKRIVEGKKTSLFYVVFMDCSKAKCPPENHFIANVDILNITWTIAPLLMVSYDSFNESKSSICVLTQNLWLSPLKPKTFEITLENIKLMINLLLYAVDGKFSRSALCFLYKSAFSPKIKSKLDTLIKEYYRVLLRDPFSTEIVGYKEFQPVNELITFMKKTDEMVELQASFDERMQGAYDQLLFQIDNEKK